MNKLNKIQQEILDACQPIIDSIKSKVTDQYNQMAEDCLKYIKDNQDKGKVGELIYSYKRKIGDKSTFLYYAFTRKQEYRYEYLPVINVKEKDEWIEKFLVEYIEMNTAKLKNAITKYINENFVQVEDIKIKRTVLGFGLNAVLTSTDGNKYEVYCEAISAGGHNIQIFHYRYIFKFRSLTGGSLNKQEIRKVSDEKEKQEKLLRKQEKDQQRDKKEFESRIKKVITGIQKLKDALWWAEYGIKTVEENPKHFPDTELQFRIDRRDQVKKKYDLFYNEKGKPRYSKEQLQQMIIDDQVDFEQKGIGDITIKGLKK